MSIYEPSYIINKPFNTECVRCYKWNKSKKISKHLTISNHGMHNMHDLDHIGLDDSDLMADAYLFAI